MTDNDFERFLGEWLASEPDAPAPWVLPSVIEHARRHPQRSWRRRLRGWLASIDGTGDRPGAASPRRRLAYALAVAAVAVLLVVPLLMRLPSQPLDDSPAVVPVPPSPVVEDPIGFGLDGGPVGSVWLEQAEGEPDSYITLHPDGIIVRVTMGPGVPVGIGTWRATGDHTLASVIAYPDADAVFHWAPGFSTYRVDWAVDDDDRSATMTWTAELHPADGSEASAAEGASTLTRQARYEAPGDRTDQVSAEPSWAAVDGGVTPDLAAGSIFAMDSVDGVPEGAYPPAYLITHGDGTAFSLNRVDGDGVGLWIPTGPDASVLSMWAGTCDSPDVVGRFVELVGSREVAARITEQVAVAQPYSAALHKVEPLGEPSPGTDHGLGPTGGSVWLEPTGASANITAYLTDGTVVAHHPELGTGVGTWRRTGDDTLAAWIGFVTPSGEGHQRWLEAIIDPAGEVMTIDIRQQHGSDGPVEVDESSATRLRIET